MRADSVTWLAAAVAVEAASMISFALLQRRMLAAAGARMPLRKMTAIALAANAMSATLPGGTALSIGYTVRRMRAWGGASAPATAFALVASGLLSGLTFTLLGVVAAFGSAPAGSTLYGVAGLVLVTVVLATQRRRVLDLATALARSGFALVGRIRRQSREVAIAPLERFAAGLRTVRTRPADWLAGAAFATANWLTDLACLVASCRALGVDEVGLLTVTCGYLAGMSASSFSFLPGGIGATDVAIILALTNGGASSSTATAAVVCYRVISLGLMVAAGWLVCLSTWSGARGKGLGIPRIRRRPHLPTVIASTNHPFPYVLEQGAGLP